MIYHCFEMDKKRQPCYGCRFLVRMSGIEPPTSCMSSKHSDRLSYTLARMIVYHIFFVNASPISDFLQLFYENP